MLTCGLLFIFLYTGAFSQQSQQQGPVSSVQQPTQPVPPVQPYQPTGPPPPYSQNTQPQPVQTGVFDQGARFDNTAPSVPVSCSAYVIYIFNF